MIVILGTVRLPPQKLEAARPVMAAMTRASRGEDGCIAYAYAEDVFEPGLIRVSEVWRDQAALDAHAKAPHLNYVGDSILGADVNLGAGTILSNFRHDGGRIHIPCSGEKLDTGRRKLGAILGDGVLTGCNSVLHPGVVVGRGTQIYPGVQLRPGVYPERSIVKLKQDLEIVPQTS